jgi:hypothetical protein
MAISQAVCRYVAEEANILLAVLRPADQLDTAEQQHVINRRHQTFTFSDPDILFWDEIIAILIPDTRKGFIKNTFALRQLNDRLKDQIDSVLFKPIAQNFENTVIVQPGNSRCLARR